MPRLVAADVQLRLRILYRRGLEARRQFGAGHRRFVEVVAALGVHGEVNGFRLTVLRPAGGARQVDLTACSITGTVMMKMIGRPSSRPPRASC